MVLVSTSSESWQLGGLPSMMKVVIAASYYGAQAFLESQNVSYVFLPSVVPTDISHLSYKVGQKLLVIRNPCTDCRIVRLPSARFGPDSPRRPLSSLGFVNLSPGIKRSQSQQPAFLLRIRGLQQISKCFWVTECSRLLPQNGLPNDGCIMRPRNFRTIQ